MKIKYLIIPIMLMFIQIVYGADLDVCEAIITPNATCKMITPVLENCTSYNYTIFDINGTNVTNGDLTVYEGSKYYFNFTEEKGEYTLELCDGTTAQVFVENSGGDSMFGMIILIPMILAIIFLIGSATLNEDHTAFKIFLFLMSIPPFFVSMHFAMIGVIEFYEIPALESTIGDITYWFSLIFVVMIMYFLIYFIWKAFGTMAQNKKEKLQY